MGRGKGEGTCFKCKKTGYFIVRATNPDGSKWVRKRKLRRDAIALLDEFNTRKRKGDVPKTLPRGLSIEKAADAWLANVKKTIRSSTYYGYARICRNQIIPNLGKRSAKNITSDDVAAFYTLLSETKSEKTGKMLSNRTVQSAGQVLSMIFDSLNVPNPCKSKAAKKPKVNNKRKTDFWTPAEIEVFLKEAEVDRLYSLFLVALESGMRQGEMFALRWHDFDFDRGTVCIDKSLEEVGSKLSIGPTKNEQSNRTITLPSRSQICLEKRWKDEQPQLHDLLFADSRGGFLRKPNVHRRHFIPLIETCGVKRIRCHDMRHSHASLLLGQRVPVHVVSRRLGHEKIQTTLDYYGHLIPQADEHLINAWDELFSSADGYQDRYPKIADAG